MPVGWLARSDDLEDVLQTLLVLIFPPQLPLELLVPHFTEDLGSDISSSSRLVLQVLQLALQLHFLQAGGNSHA